MSERVDDIDACLPQTQCTRCGYPRCRAYAQAIARGEADINRCPPGGEVTIHALAALLRTAPKALDPACGTHGPRLVAVIEEASCIGCTLCIKACPVDAIVGAAKQMHTVLTRECTGCELCIPPCPVDCIRLEPAASNTEAGPWPEYGREETQRWRARTEARWARLARKSAHVREGGAPENPAEAARIKADIAAAIARVKARRGQ